MAAVTFQQLKKYLPLILNAGHPVLIRGEHGIGKSMFVRQTSDEMNLTFVTRRASQMTEGDFCGLPSIVDGTTTFNSPDWFHTACTVPCLLFLDEVDRGCLEVRQGIFELLDSRTVFGKTLHPDTKIVAAINGGSARGAQYAVNAMDPAELDRYTVFDLIPDEKDWLLWARQSNEGIANIEQMIIDFIATEGTLHLEHKGAFEPNKVYPSRRSWHRLSDCCRGAKLLDAASDDAGADLYTVASAYVGSEAGMAFRDFVVETWKQRVEWTDVLNGKWSEKTKKFNASQHNALIDKMKAFDFVKHGLLKDSEVHEVAQYFRSLPFEIASHFWTSFVESNSGETIVNIAAVNEHVLDGVQTKDFILSMFNEKKDEEKKADEKKDETKKGKKNK